MMTTGGEAQDYSATALSQADAAARAARLKAQLDIYIKATEAGQWRRARAAIEALRAEAPERAEFKFVHAKLLFDHFNESEAALALAHEAIPGLTVAGAAYEFISSIHLSLGDMAAAWDAAENAVTIDPTSGVGYINLVKIDKTRATAFEPMAQDALERLDNSPLKKGFLFNAIGRLREAAGDFDAAWDAFAAAKSMMPTVKTDFDTSEAIVQEARALFTPSFMRERRRWGASDDRMTFVVGLPRSGTTLIERMLDAHPEIVGAGELDHLRDANDTLAARASEVTQKRVGRYAHLLDLTPNAARKAGLRFLERAEATANAGAARRIIDKMPSNFTLLGLIALILPKARIIHVNRDPLDVFVSSFKELFRYAQPHTFDPMRFAHYAILHEEIMGVWRGAFGDRILDVRYEDIVADPETEGRKMLEHIGLDWHPACAAPHLSDGVVLTASAAQVREPVHKRSVGGWRRYEKQLGELKSILERYEAARDESTAA